MHPKALIRVSIERGIIHPSIHPSKGVVGGSTGIKREANLCVNSSFVVVAVVSVLVVVVVVAIAPPSLAVERAHHTSTRAAKQRKHHNNNNSKKQTRSFRSAILRARKTRIGCCVCAICFVFENNNKKEFLLSSTTLCLPSDAQHQSLPSFLPFAFPVSLARSLAASPSLLLAN